MTQTPATWQLHGSWAELVARYGTPQHGETPPLGGEEHAVAAAEIQPTVGAVQPGVVPREEAARLEARRAALRRAMVLVEVLGAPRALRRGRGHW